MSKINNRRKKLRILRKKLRKSANSESVKREKLIDAYRLAGTSPKGSRHL